MPVDSLVHRATPLSPAHRPARSTIYDGLHRSGLPPLELTLALVHAFEADEADWQERWTAVRCQLDASAEPESPAPADSIQLQWYRRRFWSVTAVMLVLVALTASALTFAFVGRHSTPGCQRSTMYRISAAFGTITEIWSQPPVGTFEHALRDVFRDVAISGHDDRVP